MWIVYFWDADSNGVSAFINKRRFDCKARATEFCKAVEGRIEFKYAFA